MTSTIGLPKALLRTTPERITWLWVGAVASLLAHVLLIGAIVFGWPEVFTAEPPAIPVILVRDQNAPPPPEPAAQPEAQPETPPQAPALPPGAPSSQPGVPEAVDSAAVAGITAQVAKCWTAPAGWSDPREVAVTIAFQVAASGAVAEPPTVIAFRPTPAGIAAAKAAIAAVTRCGPYPTAAKRTVEVTLSPGN